MRDFAVLFHPTPNSYKRLAPGTAAGTTCSWGYDNKSMGLRVLAHSPDATRIEHRLPGADANIYLAFAAMIAGGLYGIENELPLAEASTGNAYANPDLELVPHTLDEAVRLFEESPVARTYLGDEFVDYYAATRRWELEQMRSRVTDWELRRYLARV
jgi:glutamine synthetase